MSEPTLRVRSLKYDAGEIEIVAFEEHQASDDKKEITLKSYDEPRPELLSPLKDLRAQVRRLIGVHSEWAADELTIRKVVWSYSEKTGVRGATLCCQAKLGCADAPLIFNTPHLPFEQYSTGGNAPTMPSAIIELLTTLETETLTFMRGKRAQSDLFDSEPAKRLRESIAKGEMTIEVVP